MIVSFAPGAHSFAQQVLAEANRAFIFRVCMRRFAWVFFRVQQVCGTNGAK